MKTVRLAPHEIGGVPVRVVELSGAPGDIVLAHPWMLHCSSPNCGSQPRFMAVQRIRLVSSASSKGAIGDRAPV